jgi:biopolymer transport protein ExbD
MRLPDGVNTERMAEAPIIEINRHRVSLDGREVIGTDGLATDASISRIEPLVRDLETTAHNWTILHPGEEHPQAVIIQADANTDYRVIKKVLFSAAQAGFSNISFAVNDVGS